MTSVIVGTGNHVYRAVHPFGMLPDGAPLGNTSHVATDSSDRVYVYRRQDPPVLVFDGEGNLLTTWGDGLLIDAHGICITRDDSVFLVDRDAHEVLKFDTERNVLLRLGARERPSLGTPFNNPADVKGGVKTYQRGVDVQRLCQGNGPAIMSVVAVSSQ